MRKNKTKVKRKLLKTDHILISHFCNNPNKKYTYDELINVAWGMPHKSKNSLICSIHRIRANTNLDIINIKSEKNKLIGVGYMCITER